MLPKHFLYLFIALLPITTGYRILFMCPFPAPSHWLWLEHFAKELVTRGHHVTALTNFKTTEPHPNYTEIIIEPSFDIPYHFPKKTIFEMKFNNDFQNLFMWWSVGQLTSDYALNNTRVKDLIARKDLQFDLIILEQFFHESFLMFGHKFKAPIVTIGTFGYADNMDRAMGLLTPWSFVPHLVLSYTDKMTFMQRAYNTFLSMFDLVMRRIYYIPKMQEMAEEHFKSISADSEPLPSLLDIEKNISLMLINSHRSTSPPRPSMPGLLNVGGIHIKPVKPLPRDIKYFLDNAEHGVIYFSLGSYLKSTDMPPEKALIILNTFGKLKQRVLWKYEDESIQNLPENVMVKKWLPQNDVLAHKNIVLFITHGGIFGTQEGLYYGVPMLFMPLFGDQHRNSIKSIREGYALSIDFSKLTVENLYEKITTILTDKKYRERVKELSLLFKDNPIHPMDESMYWIEYIIKYKGAKHLKSSAVHLNWWQYVLLDVFLFYFVIICLFLYIPYKILSILLRMLFQKDTDYRKKTI